MNHSVNGYLNLFVATLNAQASAALGEFVLAIRRCRTDQFSLSFLPAAFASVKLSAVGRV